MQDLSRRLRNVVEIAEDDKATLLAFAVVQVSCRCADGCGFGGSPAERVDGEASALSLVSRIESGLPAGFQRKRQQLRLQVARDQADRLSGDLDAIPNRRRTSVL